MFREYVLSFQSSSIDVPLVCEVTTFWFTLLCPGCKQALILKVFSVLMFRVNYIFFKAIKEGSEVSHPK